MAACRCGKPKIFNSAGRCTNCNQIVDVGSYSMSSLSKSRRPILTGAARVKAARLLSEPTTKCWFEVVKGVFPHQCVSECDICGKAVHPGQVVYIDRKKAVELQTPYFVMHKECMQDTLNAAPDSQYDKIRERLESGGPLF